jgi:hypothetical protein
VAKARRFILVAFLCSTLADLRASPISAQAPTWAPLSAQTRVLAEVTVELTLLSGGKCAVDGRPLDCSDLSGYFRMINARHRCRLRVHGGPNVPYVDVAAAIKSISDGGGCRIGYTNVGQDP